MFIDELRIKQQEHRLMLEEQKRKELELKKLNLTEENKKIIEQL